MGIYRTVIPDGTKIEINGEPYIRIEGCWEVDLEQVLIRQLVKNLTKRIDEEILKRVKTLKYEFL